MASPADGAAVDEGLTKVATDVPVGTGYAELLGGYEGASGMYARAEVGAHVLQPLSVFGFGQADQTSGFTAGVGAKLTFDL